MNTLASIEAATAILLVAGVLTAPISLILLTLYRRALAKAMRVRADPRELLDSVSPAREPPPPTESLSISVLETSRSSASDVIGSPVGRSLSADARNTALVYTLAGVCHAIVATLLLFAAANTEILPVRTLVTCWVNAWPIVLTVNLVMALSRRARIVSVALYFMGLLVVAQEFWLDALNLWVLWELPATIFLLFLLHRRLRAVGPLVFVFMVIGLVGTLFAGDLLMREEILRASVTIGSAVNAGAWTVLLTFLGVGFGVFGILGWFALSWIRRRYEAKRVSDQSLIIDSLWLIFTARQCISLSYEIDGWAIVGLFSFLAFTVLCRFGFALMAKTNGDRPRPRLLILRVFGSIRRSERLMNNIGARWRYGGSIQLIAGVDLATSIVEPHEFLDFIRGRLASRFIHDRKALDRRLTEVDILPDRDGRFRVNEFFCHDDTWRMTVARLVTSSDAILMDLRNFSAANQGCVHELNALVNLAPLERVVLIIDQTTDLDFTQRTLEMAWEHMDADSPNRKAGGAQLKLYPIETDAPAEIKRVMDAIGGVAMRESI